MKNSYFTFDTNMQYSESENGSVLAETEMKSDVNFTSNSEILDKRIIKNIEQKFETVPSLLEVLDRDILAKYEKEEETIYLYKPSKCSQPTESFPTCTFCEKTYATHEGLNKHYKLVHRVYRCKQCSNIFSLDDYTMHSLVHQKQYPCLQCKKSFAKKYSLERHINKHQGLASFICHLCHAGYQTRQAVEEHAQRKHKDSYSEEKRYFERGMFRQCDICEKYFQILAEFERHYLSHNNTVKYVCHTCKCEFSCEENLVKHKNIEHNPDFTETSFLKNSKSFFCTVCHFGFIRQEYLIMHMWVHQSRTQTLHVCEECGDTFQTDSELQTHYLEHVTEHYMIYDVVKSYPSVKLHSHDKVMHDLQLNRKLLKKGTEETESSEGKIKPVTQIEIDELFTSQSTNKSKNISHKLEQSTSYLSEPQIYTFESPNNISNKETMNFSSNENNTLQITSTNRTNLLKYVKAKLKSLQMLKENMLTESRKQLAMDHSLKIEFSNEFLSDASSQYVFSTKNIVKIYEILEKKFYMDSIKCIRNAPVYVSGEESVLCKGENGDQNMQGSNKNIIKKSSCVKKKASGSKLKGIYQCDICDIQCSSKKCLRLHQKRTHSNISYDCSSCDKSYERKHMLMTHERNKHGKVIPYDCRYCKRVFTLLSSLRFHCCRRTSEKTISNIL